MGAQIVWEPDRPLARCKGEGKRANAALQDYFDMGAGRNLRGLYAMYAQQVASNPQAKPPTTKQSTINGWSANLAWQARIARADEMQRDEERQRLMEEKLEREREWQRRREQVREEDWEMAMQLRSLAQQVLSEGPNFLKSKRRIVRGKGDEPDQIIITVALDGNLAVRAGEVASKLARLAADMATEHVEQDNINGEDLEQVREKRWKQIADILGGVEESDGGANA